jgi:hypothetical protein
VWFILEFYITQILISTIYSFECISRLKKVTDNNDARCKLELEIDITSLSFFNKYVEYVKKSDTGENKMNCRRKTDKGKKKLN